MAPLMLTTGTEAARLPNTFLTALVSMRSFSCVPVPWALTWSMASGERPALTSARSMASTWPCSLGAVRWWASLLKP